MSENMQFPIPSSVLEPYIKQAVSTAITSALGDGVNLVEKAVQSALAVKVNSEGKIDKYESYNRHLLIEVLAQEKIRDVTKQIINEMAESMRPKIKDQIEKQLKTKHGKIAEALVDGMISSLASTWAVKVVFDSEE